MKRALILITGVLLVATACKKKSPGQNCYTFYITDSVFSNVPALNITTNDSENHCGYTDAMRENFIRQHSGTDTVKHKNDTVIVDHLYTTWGLQ
jgi:hypothetical protein